MACFFPTHFCFFSSLKFLSLHFVFIELNLLLPITFAHQNCMGNKRSLTVLCFLVCTDLISKAIQDLLALVKLLREEVAHQSSEISHLRRLIENCASCREPEPIHIVKENCDTANPCFTGVHCYDTSTGVRCGRCPTGRCFKNLATA